MSDGMRDLLLERDEIYFISLFLIWFAFLLFPIFFPLSFLSFVPSFELLQSVMKSYFVFPT
jgi:hypothetical protein